MGIMDEGSQDHQFQHAPPLIRSIDVPVHNASQQSYERDTRRAGE
jgi:hypothetical protein